MASHRRIAVVAAFVAAGVACSDAERTTEDFSGTLEPLATVIHSVAVVDEGEIDATLTSLVPEVTIGFGVGEAEDEGSCTLIASDDEAAAGSFLSVEVEPGSYCVSVYDPVGLAEAASYDVSVTHP